MDKNKVNLFSVLYLPSFFCFFVYALVRNKGRRVLNRVRKGFNEETKVYICPYSGTGDVYLAIALLQKELETNSDNVVVVKGGSNKKIVNLFGINNVVVVNEKQMDRLTRFVGFLGENETNSFLLHPSAPQIGWGINDMLRNYDGINFMDMYRYGVFGGNTYDKILIPQFAQHSKLVEDLIKKNKIRKGKTVLLAPHSYTLGGLPKWVWEKLAIKLNDKGYVVLTNCADKKEEPIKGTKGIFIPYKDLKCFLECSGFLVAMRSGFCEVVSSIKCRKIILYAPNIYWGEGTCTDYFSMKQMGLCEDAKELEYKGIEFENYIDEIMENF